MVESTRQTQDEIYRPTAPENVQDPYPMYRRLRETDPVHYNPSGGNWVLTRHEDVAYVLRNDETFRKQLDGGGGGMSMLGADPPAHTRLRSLVNRAFTARTVEGLRPKIAGLCDELLEGVADRGEMDFIDAFAYPLPITVIAEMLGVPPEDQDQFRKWSYAIALRLGPQVDEGEAQRYASSDGSLTQYISDIVERRRAEPRDDLTSALIAAEEEGDKLTHGELIAMLVLLLVAGHETTVNLLGNGLHALLHHPGELERFRSDPGLARTAVEEFLRYDSPVQRTSRVAAEDVEVGGKAIRRGQSVSTILGAANRDPEVYDNPEGLDLGRHPNPQMSFSGGIHFCLGAQLARLEAQIAFPRILERFPRIELAGTDLRYRPAIILRGLERLPVRF